jgi:hypothetical protein
MGVIQLLQNISTLFSKLTQKKIFVIVGITRFFGLCPSSGILKTGEHKVLETGYVSVLM